VLDPAFLTKVQKMDSYQAGKLYAKRIEITSGFYSIIGSSGKYIPMILRIQLLFFWQDFVGQDGILSYRQMHLWCAKKKCEIQKRGLMIPKTVLTDGSEW